MNQNRSSTNFNILSCKPANTQPIVRQTKAQKFFQQTAQLPKSLKDDMMLSTNNPEIGGRPSKPVSVEVEIPDENDPFYQIERVTNKIGHLVANYEEQAEQEHYLMLQELDSNFQINNYDPKEILDESRKAVDGLMNKTKALKDTQAGMLDDLSDWFSREEKSLKDTDLSSNITLDTSIPVTTDDLVQVLQSTAGTSQQRVSKAIALHGDIVSHAFFAIHELQRKNKDQENLISDLKRQLSDLSSRRLIKQTSQLRPGSNEAQHRLQEALSRISAQDETIKRLNERIEQLIGESVLQSRSETTADKDLNDSAYLLKMHEALANEMKLSKQEGEINDLNDQVFKLKHELQSLQADKSFLESQALTYEEKIDLEKTRYEILQRQFLTLLNEKEDDKSENSDKANKKEKTMMSKIVELQEEIQRLNDQILNERKTSFRESEERMKMIRKEFEAREIELKRRKLNEAISTDQQQCFEALQSQHSDEINFMKKNCEETIDAMKKKFQEEKDSMEKEFVEKIKSFQKQIRDNSADSTDITKLIDMMQKRNDEKIIEIKKSFTEKIDQQRGEFQKHLNSLEDEIKKKDIEIIKLMAEMDEYKSASKALNISNENETIQKEKQVHFLNKKISSYELKIKEISESFDNEKENAVENARSEYIEQLNKASQIEALNKKLKIELDVLKSQIQKGNNDSSFNELMNDFAKQAAELNETKESLNDLKKKLFDSENKIVELNKENLKLKKSKENKLLDYVYSELFSLSRPKNDHEVVFEVDNQQHFLMKYEIAASIEPRLQEHIKKLKNKPTIDCESLFVNEAVRSVSIELSNNVVEIECPLESQLNNIDVSESVVSIRNVDISSEKSKLNSLSLNSFEIVKIESNNQHQIQSVSQHSNRDKSLSFSFPNHISIQPSEKLNEIENKNKNEIDVKETISSSRKEASQIHCIQLEFKMNDSFFINSNSNSENISQTKFTNNVAVQVEIEKKKANSDQKAVLTHQPPLEIFAVTETVVRPDQPIVLDPSSDLLSGLKIQSDASSKNDAKILLLMKSGDFVDIPATMSEVDSSTGIDAANAVSQIVMQETAEISNKLKLVVSEIQSIDEEPDAAKRAQMQETIGVELDIEKDSLISQMRERITELEQMMNRVVKQNSDVENNNVDDEGKNVGDDDRTIETVKTANVSLNSSSTQTDLVEFENVGITPTDFSSPEKIRPKNEIQMSQSFTVENETEKGSTVKELDISSPSQVFDIDLPKTVDLSAEFGLQYFNISPYSQRSQAEDNNDRKPISLQIAGKIECDYGYIQPLTKTVTNEQFSVTPANKPTLSVTSSRNFVEISEGEKTEARGTSPLDSIAYVDAAVSSTGQIVSQKTSDMIKNNTIKVEAVSNKKAFKLVTRNILNVKPVSLKGDVRIAKIQQQAEQISDLKKHILHLQFTSPDKMNSVLSSVNSSVSLINDSIKSVQSSSGAILIRQNDSDGYVVNKSVNSTSTAQSLREAIEESILASEVVVKDQNHLLSSQNDFLMRINECTSWFLNEMSKSGGATTDIQSRFLRQINEIGGDFADSLSVLQSNIANDEMILASLKKASSELNSHEKQVESLQNEILDLKLGKGKSHIAQQLADIKDELTNVIEGKSESNQIIKTKREAQRIIPKIAIRCMNNNIARQAGADQVLNTIANLSENPNDDDSHQNDWNKVISLLSEAVVMLDEHDAKCKARKIIDELNNEIKNLQCEVTKLQSDLIVAERDLHLTNDKYNAHVRSLQRSLETANEHAEMLERQLESSKAEKKDEMNENSRIRSLEEEIDLMRQCDKKRFDELSELSKKNNDLIHENQHLSEELSKLREMYTSLFNHCTDTQTTNDSLRSKTEEIFKEAEIARQRAAALEKMRQSASSQADDLAHQLTSLVSENAHLQNMIVKSQQRERELENQIIEERLKKRNSSPVNSISDDHILSAISSNDGQNTKIVKAYQQRIEECMNILARNGNDLVDLRARHATDQKAIIMIQREMRRNQNDQKIGQIRYDCAKKENGLLQKAIANRDETIRSLKREIERLRSLLRVHGPLKQKIQLFEKEKNNAESDFLNAKSKVEETEYQLKKYSSVNNKQATSYFDGLLQRQKATLARLDKRRMEIREIEEKKKLETLRAVSQVVNMAELQIPEAIIFSLMPKPSPVQKLQQRSKILDEQKRKNQREEQQIQNDIDKFSQSAPIKKPTEFDTLNSYSSSFQTRQETLLQNTNYAPNLNDNSQPKYVTQPSYADTLQMIGSLVGQKSPRTLHEMLRNSRQSKIVLPVQPAPYHKRNDTKSILTIKPLRK